MYNCVNLKLSQICLRKSFKVITLIGEKYYLKLVLLYGYSVGCVLLSLFFSVVLSSFGFGFKYT